MSDEWGPWIEHDGRGCPVRGHVIEARWLERDGSLAGRPDDDGPVWVVPGNAGLTNPSSWLWDATPQGPQCSDPACRPIIRYRIRKPRALEQLREIARNPERELEDA